MANPLDPPADLDPESRAIWVDTLAHIMEAGTLQRLDVHSLAAYVAAVRAHQKATALITASDVLIDRDGKPAPNPAVAIQQQAARTIATFARQFRLTAAAPGNAPDADHRDAAQPPMPAGDATPKLGRWCEQHHRNECTAHTKAGAPCHQLANPRTGRCTRMHDGRSKAVVLAEKLDVLPTYGAPVQISAERALIELLWRTAGHVKWLGDRVAELETAALTWGTSQKVERWWGEFPGSETIQKSGPHVLLDLYYRERKALLEISVAIVSAGLAARLVDTAQELGTASARVVDAILHDLNLSDEQWALVPVVAPRRFRELMPA